MQHITKAIPGRIRLSNGDDGEGERAHVIVQVRCLVFFGGLKEGKSQSNPCRDCNQGTEDEEMHLR